MSEAFVGMPGWQTPCTYRPPEFSHSDLLLNLAAPLELVAPLEHAPSASAASSIPPHRDGRIRRTYPFRLSSIEGLAG